MFGTTKLLMLAAVGLVVLTAGASSAGAAVTGVLIRPAGSIELTSLGLLSFTAAEIVQECRFTLRGTLERNLVRSSGTIGSISGITWSECVGGEIERFLHLPWAITVSALNGGGIETANPGRLTAIAVKILGLAWELNTFGRMIHCLWGTASESVEAEGALTRTGTNEYALGLLTMLANSLTKVSGQLCPSTGRWTGSFASVRPTQTFTFL